MTLVLVCANSHRVVHVSDRRISSNGIPVADDMSKAILLSTADARVVIGYSGLAIGPGFVARDWIPEALMKHDPPVYALQDILSAFEDRLTQRFRRIPVAPHLRRFVVQISGFVYRLVGPPLFVTATISNFHQFSTNGIEMTQLPTDQGKFSSRVLTHEASSDFWLVQAIGQEQALLPADVKALSDLLRRDATTEAIAARATAALRAARRSPQLEAVIGEDVMMVGIPADGNEPHFSRYAPRTAEASFYDVDQVFVRPDVTMALNRFEVSPVGSGTSPLSVPAVGGDRPCPCGSPFKYKRCHKAWGTSPGYRWWISKNQAQN